MVKNNNDTYFFHNLDAQISSKLNNFRIESDEATYNEQNEAALIEKNVRLYYLKYVGLSESIFLDFLNDFSSSQVKFTTTSDENDFEALNGFKSDHIDFSKIDFWGPISINMKKNKSTLKSKSMSLLVNKKDKSLIRAEFKSDVLFKNEKFDIKSDKADYIEDKKQFIFYDNLSIISENKKLFGDIFIYDIEKEKGYVKTKQQTNKRVEVYFNDKK